MYNTMQQSDLDILNDVINRREERARREYESMAGQNQLSALAKALSNMSSSAGSFYGKTPDQMGFGGIVDTLNQGQQADVKNRMAQEQAADKIMLENVQLKDLKRKKEEEQKERERIANMGSQPLAEYDRVLAEATVRQFVPDFKLPEGMTYDDLKNSALLAPLAQNFKSQRFLSPYEMSQIGIKEKQVELEEKELQQKKELEEKKLALEREKEQKRIRDLDKELKPEEKKQIEELRKAEEVSTILINDISELEEMVKKYGTSQPQDQAIDARMQAMASDIRLKLKSEELLNLGVLTGPDLKILQEQIPPVGGVQGMGLINTRAIAQLQQAKQQIAKKLQVKRNLMSEKVNNLVPSLEKGKKKTQFPLTLRKGNQKVTIENEQELKEAQAEGWQ